MAISKLLTIGESGKGYRGKYLKQSIKYILNPDKTDEGILIGAYNCQPEYAYEKMLMTKSFFEKEDKRQGYHLIVSFAKGETNAQTAYEIIERFVSEYLGNRYEAVFAVHDNTDALHGHIVFNSVSFLDGNKYRYERGDWKKYIQPMVNRLCEEYGLSTIDVDVPGQRRGKIPEHIADEKELSIWKRMIIRDMDAAIILAGDYDSFIAELRQRGYEIKTGKYLAVRPLGMERFRRTKSLGPNYTEERIRERIQQENLGMYQKEETLRPPRIKHTKCRRSHKWGHKLTPLQRYYAAKMYKIGLLKKRPYSQAYKYRNEIKRLSLIREKSLFLLRSNIEDVATLIEGIPVIETAIKRIASEKRKYYRYLKDYSDYTQMIAKGYKPEEIEGLISHTSQKLEHIKEKERRIKRSLQIANLIVEELKTVESAQLRGYSEEQVEDKVRNDGRNKR